MTPDNPSHVSIQGRLKQLTTSPGVYRFYDKNDTVLYVGKANNLKKRVSSYFQKKQNAPKNKALIENIVRFDVTVTRSEVEALLLESNLIKSLKPKYNVLLRDDKSYPFIHVNTDHDFPRVEAVRRKQKPTTGQFFGPYPNATAVREAIAFITKTFKLRTCSDSFFNARTRPCLQYQIKRCSAPCTQYITKEAYQDDVTYVLKLLGGKSNRVMAELTAQMDEAVHNLAFEDAAKLRDQIKALRVIQEQQAMVQQHGDVDIIVIEERHALACILCVTIRQGAVMSNQTFYPSVPKQALTTENQTSIWESIFSSFITHYYVNMPSRIPPLVITDHPLVNKAVYEQVLTEFRGKKTQLQVNPKHHKKQRWLDFARHNLKQALTDAAHASAMMKERYDALQACLGMKNPIQRMECFDISHTQGHQTVASCVVFDDKGPCKRDYRIYNIAGITPGDDYAAMKQALLRRMQSTKKPRPDLLLIDGGQGQVNVAKAVLADLDIQDTLILGIAKGPARKAGEEALIPDDITGAFRLPADSPALHLLQQIRDEAHRFAITRHRKKRSQEGLRSTLDTIPGVGAKRRTALLKRFGGIRELSKAPTDEIAKTPGISQALAEVIFAHFHG